VEAGAEGSFQSLGHHNNSNTRNQSRTNNNRQSHNQQYHQQSLRTNENTTSTNDAWGHQLENKHHESFRIAFHNINYLPQSHKAIKNEELFWISNRQRLISLAEVKPTLHGN
jgi:hypothetical protein